LRDGYLEVELVGSYAGLLTLAVGGKSNNVVAGERCSHYLTPPIRICLQQDHQRLRSPWKGPAYCGCPLVKIKVVEGTRYTHRW
jgi:hypothetical protein